MFASSMTEEVRTLEEEIEAVKERVDDPVMCEKIRRYVYAPREIQGVYKADAGEYYCWRILRSGGSFIP
jgi:hypothetical protein